MTNFPQTTTSHQKNALVLGATGSFAATPPRPSRSTADHPRPGPRSGRREGEVRRAHAHRMGEGRRHERRDVMAAAMAPRSSSTPPIPRLQELARLAVPMLARPSPRPRRPARGSSSRQRLQLRAGRRRAHREDAPRRPPPARARSAWRWKRRCARRRPKAPECWSSGRRLFRTGRAQQRPGLADHKAGGRLRAIYAPGPAEVGHAWPICPIWPRPRRASWTARRT